ncbi:hypothetical protein AYI68_g4723 [Smittium mucronatum]|uniref:Uncharacterized protein n=1 Tax=Smittium mucronatum TaxID=133383 RepID=A0A1R0GWG2_9FUNG|nr:hypothetical protein AYI68_g4723 [Smittium mucronatum]
MWPLFNEIQSNDSNQKFQNIDMRDQLGTPDLLLKKKLDQVGGIQYSNALDSCNQEDMKNIDNDIRKNVEYSLLVKNLNFHSLPKVIEMLNNSKRNSPAHSVKDVPSTPVTKFSQHPPPGLLEKTNSEGSYSESSNFADSQIPFDSKLPTNRKYNSNDFSYNETPETSSSRPYYAHMLENDILNSFGTNHSQGAFFSPNNIQPSANTAKTLHKRKNFGQNRENSYPNSMNNDDSDSIDEKFTTNYIMKQHFLVKIGQAMGDYGCPTYSLESDLYRMANFLKIKASFAIYPGVFFTFFEDNKVFNNETKICTPRRRFEQ